MQNWEPWVDLADSGIHVEITGTTRAGIMRFRYPKKNAWIVIENNALRGGGYIQIDVARQEITGANTLPRLYAGNGKPAGFSGYFVIQFDRPFKVGGTWSGGKRSDGVTRQEATEGAPGAFVSFDLKTSTTVEARIGTSFTSIDEARRNLNVEIPNWDFDMVAQQSHDSWNNLLERIHVSGSSLCIGWQN